MAKPKKRRKPRSRPASAGNGEAQAASRGGANVARRERKEEARQAREAARKAAQRRASFRRAVTLGVVGLVVFGVLLWVQRAASPRRIPAVSVQAADAAGCSDVSSPESNPDRTHLDPGASFTYPSEPATSGPHDPSPLPDDPKVLGAQPPETQAVHSLEHGAVLAYYRASGDNALPQDVIDRLKTTVSNVKNLYLAPHESLPAGTSLAMTAWNKLQTCPAGITPDQAALVVKGFSHAYACTSNAPEPKNAPDGC
jgi:hypothetical protein